MAAARAAAGDEGQYAALIQPDGFGGSEVVCRQNNRLLCAEFRFPLAGENAGQPARHIADVRCARLHVSILHRFEHRGKFPARRLNGIFGAAALRFYFFPDAGGKILILGQQGMRLKQRRRFLARLFPALPGQRFQLPDRLFLRRQEAFPLLCRIKPLPP